MPDVKLESFKSNLLDLARPNRFLVKIVEEESNFGFNDEDWYFVKTCSIPGKTMGEIELNWVGHKYKLAGDPTFNDVTITFWNNEEEDGVETVRDKFIKWFSTTSDDPNNVRATHNQYKCTVYIQQLNGQNAIMKTYKLIYAHPKEMSDIELSMESTDAAEDFTVVFSYSYFEVADEAGDGSNLGSNTGERAGSTGPQTFTA